MLIVTGSQQNVRVLDQHFDRSAFDRFTRNSWFQNRQLQHYQRETIEWTPSERRDSYVHRADPMKRERERVMLDRYTRTSVHRTVVQLRLSKHLEPMDQ